MLNEAGVTQDMSVDQAPPAVPQNFMFPSASAFGDLPGGIENLPPPPGFYARQPTRAPDLSPLQPRDLNRNPPETPPECKKSSLFGKVSNSLSGLLSTFATSSPAISRPTKAHIGTSGQAVDADKVRRDKEEGLFNEPQSNFLKCSFEKVGNVITDITSDLDSRVVKLESASHSHGNRLDDLEEKFQNMSDAFQALNKQNVSLAKQNEGLGQSLTARDQHYSKQLMEIDARSKSSSNATLVEKVSRLEADVTQKLSQASSTAPAMPPGIFVGRNTCAATMGALGRDLSGKELIKRANDIMQRIQIPQTHIKCMAPVVGRSDKGSKVEFITLNSNVLDEIIMSLRSHNFRLDGGANRNGEPCAVWCFMKPSETEKNKRGALQQMHMYISHHLGKKARAGETHRGEIAIRADSIMWSWPSRSISHGGEQMCFLVAGNLSFSEYGDTFLTTQEQDMLRAIAAEHES